MHECVWYEHARYSSKERVRLHACWRRVRNSCFDKVTVWRHVAHTQYVVVVARWEGEEGWWCVGGGEGARERWVEGRRRA